MSDKIMNLRPPLTHLEFSNLMLSKELAQQGGQILHNLASIAQPTLSYLDLGKNEDLWGDKARFNLLLKVI